MAVAVEHPVTHYLITDAWVTRPEAPWFLVFLYFSCLQFLAVSSSRSRLFLTLVRRFAQYLSYFQQASSSSSRRSKYNICHISNLSNIYDSRTCKHASCQGPRFEQIEQSYRLTNKIEHTALVWLQVTQTNRKSKISKRGTYFTVKSKLVSRYYHICQTINNPPAKIIY